MMTTQNTRLRDMTFCIIMMLFFGPYIQNKFEFLSSNTLNLIIISFVEVLLLVLFIYISNALEVLFDVFKMKEFTMHKFKKELKEHFSELFEIHFIFWLIILTINTIVFFIINKWVTPVLPMSIDLAIELLDRLFSRF